MVFELKGKIVVKEFISRLLKTSKNTPVNQKLNLSFIPNKPQIPPL